MRKKQASHIVFIALLLVLSLGRVEQASGATPYVIINKNASETNSRKVELYLQGPSEVRHMQISNDPQLKGADWEFFRPEKTWYFDYGPGQKTVYLKFKDKNNVVSAVYADNIQLSVPQNMEVDFTINDGSAETDSRYVQLTLKYSLGVDAYLINNNSDFAGLPFNLLSIATSTINWVLSSGDGEKTVWVQFKDAVGKIKTVSKKIKYRQPSYHIPEKSLIKGQTETVYYLGEDGLLHPFVNSLVYHSWFADFNDIKSISNVKLRQYEMGEAMCARPGTWLLKFRGLARVYAVEPGCELRPLRSEAEAYLLYGSAWAKRILELDLVHQSSYKILSHSAADEEKQIEDKDRDGVDKSTEEKYDASDRREDTDFDGLSDYEEIYYWFSDPRDPDTDRDGFKDGREILSGHSPTSEGRLEAGPENAYQYPRGAIIKRKEDNKLYYRHSNGNYYYAGKDAGDKMIKGNRLQERFVIDSPHEIKFSPVSKRKIGEQDQDIYYPLKSEYGRLRNL